ncbi:zeta toxin family protein [Mycobacterium marinum]|uniref:zeta toxin family protein n=1 Tax=Mycobacterium marinum TaxID=1781 RepID=UPI00045FE830|nr:zeta toxin family protein [Mycobacterium marinum]CDM77205.1 inference=ab initio prediction:Prodigal:2.60,protein motif:Cdd:COG4185 [Mycobacterium marinum E11]
MRPFPDLRAQVAAQLTELSAPGAPLHRDSDQSTARLYPRGDIGRARFQKDTIDWYLSQANPRLGGRTAIVTAGPPGAGKSALVKARIADLDEYRIIDADIIKDHLVRQAIADGIYDRLLTMAPFADGHGLAPRELSALVHVESVRLAEAIRETCTSLKENVVIEGTLTWHLQGPNIFRELADNDYFDVEVYGIDIGQEEAHESALDRWWKLRLEWAKGQDSLGGRFTPADAIDMCYPAPGAESVCTTNAKNFINTAIQTGEIPRVHVTILRRAATGPMEVIYERSYLQ